MNETTPESGDADRESRDRALTDYERRFHGRSHRRTPYWERAKLTRPWVLVAGLVLTLRDVFIRPSKVYGRMALVGQWRPFFYLVICSLLWTISVKVYPPLFRREYHGNLLRDAGAVLYLAGSVIFWVFAEAQVAHRIARRLSDRRVGYRAVAKVYLYARGAGFLCGLIPMVGFWIGLAWGTVSSALGLACVYHVSAKKGIAAAMLALAIVAAVIIALNVWFWMPWLTSLVEIVQERST